MSDQIYSQYRSTSREELTRAADGGVSPTVLRVICGLFAPFAFGCAGLCFYFLISPFGKNPPPKEVALIAGIVFTCIGVGFVGVAIFYRGAGSPTQLSAAGRGPDAFAHQSAQWPQQGSSIEFIRDAGLVPGREPGPRRNIGRELLGVGCLLGLLIGPGLGYVAFQRQTVMDMGKPEPHTLSVTDLGRNGPGDNIHVKITNFRFGEHYAVRSKGGSWINVCLAAFPKDRSGDAKALKVVVRTSRVHNEQELREFAKRAEIQGVVVNSIYEWENDKQYMKSAYPAMDTTATWVVQDDYTFPNPSEIKTMYGIAGGIAVLALFCGIGALINKQG
jgi:hypothetical protein